MPWLDDEPPAPPSAARNGRGLTLRAPGGEPVRQLVVQARWTDGSWTTEIIPAGTARWNIGSRYGVSGEPVEVWVSSVDRAGNQSEPVRVEDSSG